MVKTKIKIDKDTLKLIAILLAWFGGMSLVTYFIL
jgi:phage shock protein PspC (stress-responsive transcriptional regulator)